MKDLKRVGESKKSIRKKLFVTKKLVTIPLQQKHFHLERSERSREFINQTHEISHFVRDDSVFVRDDRFLFEMTVFCKGIVTKKLVKKTKTNQKMLESNFLKSCETALIALSEAVENRDKNSKLDVEYSDGILTIIIEATSQTYIINRHAASQKIWYSSPFSGANYFSFDETSQNWLDSKGEKLEEKLFSELQKILN